ncbi:MAG: xylose isomerase [Planctomycetaceae bacterium]|nr:MAG: xylose isomerase [Planctomycetaceae bacterium]
MDCPPPRIGYCTNVHAGTDLSTIRQTLETHAAAIARRRRRSRPDAGPLPVGLWIPASAAKELAGPGEAEAFAGWLAERDLSPLTFNGFPYDNFHLPVVKHRVYRPAWWDAARADYTLRLAELFVRMLGRGDGPIGSISTLPLGWPGRLGRSARETGPDDENVSRAGERLRELADELKKLERRSGRRIVIAIEPEPGCLLDRCDDVIGFFERELPLRHHRRYLTVCHDICHSAVMFESQAGALAAYAEAGLMIGKVQVSGAIDVPLAKYSAERRQAVIEELRGFAEDRYLHQTGILDADGDFRLVEDLPRWLAELDKAESRQGSTANRRRKPDPQTDRHLRIHFHVPIFRQRLGQLASTQAAILECVRALGQPDAPEFTGHYEVETYAWSVLPERLRPKSLAQGIAKELDWFEAKLAAETAQD